MKTWQTLKRNITTENIIKYRKANALFKRELKIVKRTALSTFTTQIQPTTTTTKIWSNIRRLCGLNNIKHIHSIIDPETNLPIADKLTIATTKQADNNNFSNHFIQSKNALSHTLLPPSNTAQQIEKEINMIELISALKYLKGHTPGLDRISYPMIQKAPPILLNRILKHFNLILDSFIPQSYKTSLTIPILKPNSNKTDINSYRPIALNPCLSKVIDKIIAKRLWWFVDKNKLIHTNQTGFRRGKSVTDNLLYLDHLITDTLAHKKHLSILSLDFSKAFDRVGIHAVATQLKEWKIGPKIYNYIISFMSNRKIKCRVSNCYSEQYPNQNGIPQGSPISVILFLISYNKLANIIHLHKNLNFIAYADDFHILIKFHKYQKNIQHNLDLLFSKINEWCASSGASLSTNKCKHLHICKKHHCQCSIHTSNFTLKEATTLRTLGLTLKKKYKWNDHINKLTTSLNNTLNVPKWLSRTKINCNTNTLITILKTTLLPKIDYGLIFFGNAPNSILRKIQTIINTAIRIKLEAFRTTPTNNLLLEANINTIFERREFLIAKSIKNLSLAKQSPTHNILSQIKTNKTKKTPSVLCTCISLCSNYPIHTSPSN